MMSVPRDTYTTNPLATNKINSAITACEQVPKEKYDYPITSAQEIGWYSKPLVDNSKWNYPVSSTPISQYADRNVFDLFHNLYLLFHKLNSF